MTTSTTAPNAEWSLLLAACSTNRAPHAYSGPALKESVRWDALLELADQHGLTPLLYRSLSQENNFPASVVAHLRQRNQTNLYKSLLIAREMIRVIDRLAAENIEAMPYKGAALAESMYGDIALRQSGDIDLLIHSKDFLRIKNILAEIGYTPHLSLTSREESAYLSSGYECAFDSAAGRNLLEVQWAIQPRFYAVDLDTDELFRRAANVTVAGRRMKTPSPEDLLIILSVHAAKHAWERLIWLCDIAQIMKLPGLNWDAVEDQSRFLGVVRILRITLLLAKRLLATDLPETIQNIANADGTATSITDEIYNGIISETKWNAESLAYFRLMLRVRERRADRLKFLRRLILTPGPGEWKAVPLPAPLFPLYRLVRLSRLAVRLSRA